MPDCGRGLDGEIESECCCFCCCARAIGTCLVFGRDRQLWLKRALGNGCRMLLHCGVL